MLILDFPFPDVEQAATCAYFPPNTLTSGLEIDRLPRLSISGGNVKNIALYALFLAPGEGVRAGTGHLKRTASREGQDGRASHAGRIWRVGG